SQKGQTGPTVLDGQVRGQLRGPAGVGKTHLLQTLLAGLEGRQVFHGRSDRLGAPHDALISLLRDDRDLPTDEHRQALIRRLDGLEGASVGRPSLPVEEVRCHEAVVDHILDAGPAVVVIDDAQWLDPDSGMALVRLLGRADSGRCHLLLVWRSGELADDRTNGLLADLTALATLSELTLGPLSKEDTSALADELGVAEHDPVHLYERTGGSPLLVHELARLEAGAAEPDGPIVDLLTQRVVADDRARELLQIAAVMGDRFGLDDLLTVFGGDREAAYELLAACERSMVLSIDHDRVEFTNGLVPELILASLTAIERQALHARVFEALAERCAPGLAHHAREAHPLVDPRDAIAALRRAAADARRRLAYERA
ncbi:MAG: AAA family ATPase, partial [Actinomycetota bacterium]